MKTVLLGSRMGSVEVFQIPAELDNFANLPNLSNIFHNHKKIKSMDPKWSPILKLAMVLVT